MVEIEGVWVNGKHVTVISKIVQSQATGNCEMQVFLTNGQPFKAKFRTVAEAEAARAALIREASS